MPKGRSNIIGSLLNSVVWGSAGWQAEMTGSRIVRTKIDLFMRPPAIPGFPFWPPGSAVLYTDPFPGRPDFSSHVLLALDPRQLRLNCLNALQITERNVPRI